eukprot:CAMPEP_0170192660 /NCGR_PEP_ID=MMETSP0040_2-20121228/54846_1 /TAXON_ID=641309 /ORGANISM="Lotharella oceanica, Strain CCMP622" /LENGTH=225 /DNA_ID=CAMNT_0010441091 /DNA_START=55 /DNA_END=733 /DNA_ORIENTATION=+
MNLPTSSFSMSGFDGEFTPLQPLFPELSMQKPVWSSGGGEDEPCPTIFAQNLESITPPPPLKGHKPEMGSKLDKTFTPKLSHDAPSRLLGARGVLGLKDVPPGNRKQQSHEEETEPIVTSRHWFSDRKVRGERQRLDFDAILLQEAPEETTPRASRSDSAIRDGKRLNFDYPALPPLNVAPSRRTVRLITKKVGQKKKTNNGLKSRARSLVATVMKKGEMGTGSP